MTAKDSKRKTDTTKRRPSSPSRESGPLPNHFVNCRSTSHLRTRPVTMSALDSTVLIDVPSLPNYCEFARRFLMQRLFATSLLLILSAVPAVASEDGSGPCGTTGVAAPALTTLDSWIGTAPAAEETAIADPSAQASCTAQCQYGTVKCTGSSCTATDANCEAGIRGFCTGDGGTTYCPECELCVASLTCDDGSVVSCSTYSGFCTEVEPCGVRCDNVWHWCPAPLPPSCPQFG